MFCRHFGRSQIQAVPAQQTDRQRQTETDRDRPRQTETDSDRQTATDRQRPDATPRRLLRARLKKAVAKPARPPGRGLQMADSPIDPRFLLDAVKGAEDRALSNEGFVPSQHKHGAMLGQWHRPSDGF